MDLQKVHQAAHVGQAGAGVGWNQADSLRLAGESRHGVIPRLVKWIPTVPRETFCEVIRVEMKRGMVWWIRQGCPAVEQAG